MAGVTPALLCESVLGTRHRHRAAKQRPKRIADGGLGIERLASGRALTRARARLPSTLEDWLWHYWEGWAGNAWGRPGDSEKIACCSLVFLVCCSCAPLVLPGLFRLLGGPFGPPPRVSWPG